VRAVEAGARKAPGTRTPTAYSDATHYGAPVQIDVFETGNGQIEVPGVSDKTPDTVIYLSRPGDGGQWSVETQDVPKINGLQARNLDDLAAKVADTLGISGRVSVYDIERDRAKGSHAFDYVAKTAPAAPEQAPRSSAFNPRVADGGNLPARREGETDGMYHVRVAPSDTAAENLLKGYSIAGLKAMARDAGIPGTASMSKAKLIEALMLPRRRYWDSIAVERQR
jgi:hypothetical protein